MKILDKYNIRPKLYSRCQAIHSIVASVATNKPKAQILICTESYFVFGTIKRILEEVVKMTKVYNWKNNIDEKELNNVVEVLKNGGLVIVPTETVYGLAASAFLDDACKKIFIAKGRAQDNPLIVHVSNKKMIYDIVEKPNVVEEKLIDAFMPGPFTLILNKKSCICDTVTCSRRNGRHKNAN